MRKQPASSALLLQPQDEASLLVSEELALEKMNPSLDQQAMQTSGEEAVVSVAVLQREENSAAQEEDGGGANGPQVSPSNLVIAGLGDILLLKSLVDESRRIGNFSHLWRPSQHLYVFDPGMETLNLRLIFGSML